MKREILKVSVVIWVVKDILNKKPAKCESRSRTEGSVETK